MSTDNMWKYDFLHKSNGLQKQKQSLKCIYEHYITVGLFILEDVSSSKWGKKLYPMEEILSKKKGEREKDRDAKYIKEEKWRERD